MRRMAHETRTFGVLTDIMDGEKWKTVEGPDGRPFFDNDPNRERARMSFA